ncbi:MAG: CCA tRNA nucleotidyltransferase [Parachlamydia sp.]|jgi:poly(A) polymerase|nr:CCA tRNA nucleotidyltransferase [Parachlamydia sp.]
MDAITQAKIIVTKLARAGHIAYFAGGWVRDYIMGHPSDDIDIATSAAPEEIMALFSDTILVGLAFGVVVVILEGHQFEVATFRKDLGYVDGRHPIGVVKSTPREDALRRDFTINGMFYDPLTEEIHDYVHGREDIRHGIIRTIGNPHDRFFEDRLRMLRAFRFAARFSFNIDPETQAAILENANKLFPAVAMERVWMEFKKMAAYPSFDQAIVEMHRSTLLDVIFPEMAGMHIKDLRHIAASFHHYPPNTPTILYILALFPNLEADKKIELAKRLKASSRDVKLIEYVEHVQSVLLKGGDRHQWGHIGAHPACRLALEWIAAPFSESEKQRFLEERATAFEQIAPHIQRLKNNTPLLSSEALRQEGIQPGKHMGLLLKEAEKMAINQNYNDASALLDALKKTPLWKL